MPEPKNTFVCEQCGASYTTESGLKRHLSSKHGAPLSESAQRHRRKKEQRVQAAMTDEDSVSFQVRAQLRELASPLREQLREIERRLASLNREAQDLREARQQIERMLRNLEGPQAPAKGAGDLSGANHAAKQQAVERYIEANYEELKDGFTATNLEQAMKAANQTPPISVGKTLAIVRDLHARGLLRADRVIRGGATLYMPVGVKSGG
jgi:TolA-binding protein